MGRKRDPNTAIADFGADTARSLRDLAHLHSTVGDVAVAKNASVDAFMRIAVRWETFRSDWHIAAVARDASQFRAFLETEAVQLVAGDYPYLGAFIDVNMPLHPTLDAVGKLLDSRDRNVSIPTLKAWQVLAGQHLADPYKARVLKFHAYDKKFHQLVVTLRNAIAHRSGSSIVELNAALADLDPKRHAQLIRYSGTQKVAHSGIGSYLHADMDRHGRRVVIFHNTLRALALRLMV